MKIPYFFVLAVCTSTTAVYAESPKLLPPVLENSTYSDSLPEQPSPQQPLPDYDDASSLDKIQSDMSALKNKIKEQEDAINHLKNSNTELQKKLTGSSKSLDIGSKSKPKSKSKAVSKLPVLDANLPTPATKKAANTGSEKERYQRASALLKKEDYTQAKQEFEALIKAYPSSKYADNAQYWIGVALLNKGDKKGAIQAFDRVARVYPKSEKIPEALFKLGNTLLTMNEKAKAKEYFDYVIQKYPGTNGALLSAKKKAQVKL